MSQVLPLSQLDALAKDRAFLRLDKSLRRFNIFEAVGAVRQELRHSDFLAFLLNPYSNRSFKGRFTEILLDETAHSPTGKKLPAAFRTKSGIFDNAEVRREWCNIDILLRCTASKMALIIENKIDSRERKSQLNKYWETVAKPGWKVCGIYLTPGAEEPSNDNYIPVGYELISGSLERLLKEHAGKLTGDFKIAVRHYIAMIKRNIAMPHKLEDKCWDIYTKHKPAIDVIRRYVDQSDPIRRYLKELIGQRSPTLTCTDDRTGYVQFRPMQWKGKYFLGSKRRLEDLIFFEFQYGDAQRAKGSLVLLLAINTADNGRRDPKKAFDLAKQNGPPFIAQRSFTKWPTIFSEELISREDIDKLDLSTQKKKIKRRWNDFLNETLPSLNKAIQKHFTA
jgi:hypothetical protein